MSNIVDFTNCEALINDYEGAQFKQKIEYNGQIYMLKLSSKLEQDENNPLQTSYSNSPVAEYLGSHIYETVGIPAQQTILGKYADRPAVACLDFIANRDNPRNFDLIEFNKLETSFLGSSSAGGKTPLYDNLVEILKTHKALEPIRAEAAKRYWQMFIVDALIRNFDRHAANWGYILNRDEKRLVGLAPIYDCGSSFYPKLKETVMQDFVLHPEKLEDRTYIFPTAALRVDNKKVRYHEFLLSDKGADCRQELLELYPKINLEKIYQVIEETPGISDIQREFYCKCIEVRSRLILEPGYEKALDEHHHAQQKDKTFSLAKKTEQNIDNCTGLNTHNERDLDAPNKEEH